MEDTIQFKVPATLSSSVREQIETLLGGAIPDLRVIVLKDITSVVPDQAIHPHNHQAGRVESADPSMTETKAVDVAGAIFDRQPQASPGLKAFLRHSLGPTELFEYNSSKGGSLIPDTGAALRGYAVAFSKFLKKHTCLYLYAQPMAQLAVSKPLFLDGKYQGVIYYPTALGARVYAILAAHGYFPKV